MARGRDLDRTARNAVTGVDQPRIVANYPIELPLGVDFILERDRQRIVVQAKHWQRDVVGVSLVRELYGVQRAMGADGAMFVVLGMFSIAAARFAAQVGMTLVDRSELLRIIGAGLADMPYEGPAG
jgi:hypothetical protein